MHSLPFDKPGRFYRGNLHTHSTRSDGAFAPEAVVTAYRGQGYDFLALTDHFKAEYGFPITDTRPYRTENFTTILGAELHAPALENGDEWHIVAAGLPTDFAPTTPDETGPMLAARAAEAGAFVGMAHPAWYGMSFADALSLQAAHAVEIYNYDCDRYSARGDGWYVADYLANLGRRLSTFATDDAHFKRGTDAFGGWVMVRAESLDPDALLAALRAGHFYSSCGPTIHDISVEGDALTVRCSPARAVVLDGRISNSRMQEGAGITEYTFSLDGFRDAYCRVTVVDMAGKRAWSNPIWFA